VRTLEVDAWSLCNLVKPFLSSFLVVLGFELTLSRWALHQPFPVLVIFGVGSNAFFVQDQPQTSILLSMASCIAGITDVSHHVCLFIEMGVLLTFCQAWPLTVILLISTSQIAGIIDVSHWHLALYLPVIQFPHFFFKDRFSLYYSPGHLGTSGPPASAS
jgi:hypothetical protein